MVSNKRYEQFYLLFYMAAKSVSHTEDAEEDIYYQEKGSNINVENTA
jgi:hypothetical protein